MPIGRMHKERKSRNWMIAGILVLLIVGLFFLTMINMQDQVWSGN